MIANFVRFIPEGCVQQRTAEQIVDVRVPLVIEEDMEIVRLERSSEHIVDTAPGNSASTSVPVVDQTVNVDAPALQFFDGAVEQRRAKVDHYVQELKRAKEKLRLAEQFASCASLGLPSAQARRDVEQMRCHIQTGKDHLACAFREQHAGREQLGQCNRRRVSG